MKERLLLFFEKYETHLEVGFFLGGFIFDIWMLAAPDELLSIVQQIVYLGAIWLLIHLEFLFRLHRWKPKGIGLKLWPYRTFILHFLLGSLLSVYSLFFIKSASVFSSLVFLLLMLAILLANEFPIFKKSNVSLKVGLFSVCLFSFFSILYPIFLGFVGLTPFVLAVLTTIGLVYLYVRKLKNVVQDDVLVLKSLFAPTVSVMGIFCVFYVFGWIPPVPLSVKTQGVYHQIKKEQGKYLLSFEKDWTNFFHSGESEFKAEPGDKIYFYAQIYSPARISDSVVIHWHQKNSKNDWVLMDKIPLPVQGGRQDGYRGFTFKGNYTPGEWKIEVRTQNGIEISRLYFTVTAVPLNTDRQFTTVEK